MTSCPSTAWARAFCRGLPSRGRPAAGTACSSRRVRPLLRTVRAAEAASNVVCVVARHVEVLDHLGHDLEPRIRTLTACLAVLV